MLISLQSTMEFITTTNGKPALIFDGSRIHPHIYYCKCDQVLIVQRAKPNGTFSHFARQNGMGLDKVGRP